MHPILVVVLLIITAAGAYALGVKKGPYIDAKAGFIIHQGETYVRLGENYIKNVASSIHSRFTLLENKLFAPPATGLGATGGSGENNASMGTPTPPSDPPPPAA